MSQSLNVIALISGGKDSFYSLIHCVQNGHNVVALGNLHPRPPASKDDEKDLNSFMYQTVGHTVIPLYEKALGIPLYRQEIQGSAVQTGTSYSDHPQSSSSAQDEDETESLVPLLKRIMIAHPEANAISTGAILSTYQRTRIESVALRLGLTPLSFLWQYPNLPPATQISLLQDMHSTSLNARVIKVASGGLNEDFLWVNVASIKGMTSIERAMSRFGDNSDGSVIGEGGEFETLVIDGPDWLFKGRIEIVESDRKVVREGGGAAWLALEKARVEMKDGDAEERNDVRIPRLLDLDFEASLKELEEEHLSTEGLSLEDETPASNEQIDMHQTTMATTKGSGPSPSATGGSRWTIASSECDTGRTAEEEITSHVQKIKDLLTTDCRPASDINFALIILRSMDDFTVINKIYGSLFTEPNPPARVTIASGDALRKDQHVILHLTLRDQRYPAETKKALHVQSRSYWAPANIGPYSQAISIPQSDLSSAISNRLVHVAGQIPLIPGTMALPEPSPTNFELQTILSLQHLWRIGLEMNIGWWTSAVAFLPRDTQSSLSRKARLAGQAWEKLFLHKEDDIEEEERDLWDEKYRGGFARGAEAVEKKLPDWENVDDDDATPPFFAAEVETLPRGSGIEWYAHLGVIGAGIKTHHESDEHGAQKYVCAVKHSFGQTILLVPYVRNTDTHERLEAMRKSLGTDRAEVVEVYADANLWAPVDIRGVISCRSLWNKSGERLAAVLIARTST